MQTFRIEYDAEKRKRDARVRLLGWGTVVALFLAVFLVFILGFFPRVVTVWEMTIAAGGACLGAGALIGHELRRRADRDMVFLMDENGITKRREGFPDERINYTEIRSLHQRRWWLFVGSTKPYASMIIPKSVTGFETIRDELAGHDPAADRIRTKASPLRIGVSLIAYSLCWVPIIVFLIYKLIRR